MKTTDVEIFLGLDVGKTDHWACALAADGTKIWNKTLPNDETKLTSIYHELSARGAVLVDQPATIGALAIAVAQDLGISVAYLPGLTKRRIADMYPGTAKTDEKDAFIIADAARTMPHTLRGIAVSDENEATLGMLTGFDLDLARQITQTSNRIRGLFTHIHPALEQVIGPWLEHDAVLEVLVAWPTPATLKHAGKAWIAPGLVEACKPHSRRINVCLRNTRTRSRSAQSSSSYSPRATRIPPTVLSPGSPHNSTSKPKRSGLGYACTKAPAKEPQQNR